MNEYLEALFRLYEGLERQGPGSTQSTLKALNLIRNDLPLNPQIIDMGCGCGAQTFVLAKELEGKITAIDIYQPYLNQIAEYSRNKAYKSMISCLNQDMVALSLDSLSFDLIWSEGAIYIMGFENGLRTWQSFLRPGGFMVISELSWFRNDPPKEALDYWQQGYPGIKSIPDNLSVAKGTNLEIVGHFSLPDEDWWISYYNPLQIKIDELIDREKPNPGMKSVIRDTIEEMEIMKKYSYFCGYEFYILKKPKN